MNHQDHASTRYARQVRLSQIGQAGQIRLREARVAIVGMGALGSAVAEWLARAGVGYLRVIDRDVVEWTNLSRQVLYTERDAREALPKAVAAVRRLQLANADITYEAIVDDLDGHNARTHLTDVDIIVDGTDNYATRRLINDVSVLEGTPWAYAGAVSTYGSTALIRPGETPCFACLFPEDDPTAYDTCDTVGVFGPVIGMVAAIEATAVVKYLVGDVSTGVDGITTVDAWENTQFTALFPARRPDCPCCVQREFKAINAQKGSLAVTMCGRDTVQIRPQASREGDEHISLTDFANRLTPLGRVSVTAHILRFEIADSGEGFYLFPNARALVFGVEDIVRAKVIYARYIGM